MQENSRGIVRPSLASRHFDPQRWAPDPPLDRFVDRFWRTAWDLAEPFTQSIVTFPAVNLVFQADRSAVVSGVQRHNDARRLEGRGWALGVMFRTGGFRPFSDRPLASLVDSRVAAGEIFGPEMDGLVRAVVDASDDERRIDIVSRYLVGMTPAEPTVGEALSDLIESAVAHYPPVTRVADLVARAAVSTRTLQRQFREHVGVGPKLVLDRYRIQAAGEVARSPPRSWIDVAQRLGYADQAHLTADMSRTFGQPPAAYARQESARRSDGSAPTESDCVAAEAQPAG